jgi:hypothetical protein
MSEISIECNVTEFAVYKSKKYDKVVFYLNEKCLVISFMDKNENVLNQTEIGKKDAIDLANVIFLKYK